MYFTHEESFGVLPVIPLALCCFTGLRWTRNWRWWVFGAGAAAIICVQLALAKFTHPPFFGVDPSGGPLIQWSPQPFYYFSNFFFADPTYGASITVVSCLAVVGVVVGSIPQGRYPVVLRGILAGADGRRFPRTPHERHPIRLFELALRVRPRCLWNGRHHRRRAAGCHAREHGAMNRGYAADSPSFSPPSRWSQSP